LLQRNKLRKAPKLAAWVASSKLRKAPELAARPASSELQRAPELAAASFRACCSGSKLRASESFGACCNVSSRACCSANKLQAPSSGACCNAISGTCCSASKLRALESSTDLRSLLQRKLRSLLFGQQTPSFSGASEVARRLLLLQRSKLRSSGEAPKAPNCNATSSEASLKLRSLLLL